MLSGVGGVGSSKFISVKLGMSLNAGVEKSMSKSDGNGKSDNDSLDVSDIGNGAGCAVFVIG